MNKNVKKPVSLILAFLCAGSMLLCACNKAEETTTTESTTAATAAELSETTPSDTKDQTSYEKITLDGVRENHYVSTDYCYIESEKYVLLIDKDIDLPGDFAVVMDAIIDELERQLGISFAPADFRYGYGTVCDYSIYYDGFNPWKGWDVGSKIPIFLIADRNAEGLISGATADSAMIIDYDMFSKELWNSIPEFRDNPWRLNGYVDYSIIAHELTHTITGRHCELSEIMTEGIADYMKVKVIDALADKYPSIAEVKEHRGDQDYRLPEKVNSSNAEEIFAGDYHDISHADRGAEYTYGKYFFKYLNEQFGDDYFKNIIAKIKSLNLSYQYGMYNENDVKAMTEALKELYGNDVFSEFGDWCVKKNYLQRT